MYIDTHTKKNMENSICKYLDIELSDLLKLFNKSPFCDKFLDMDKLIRIIYDFLSTCKPKEEINQILFFHLSRRLNVSIGDVTGYNLMDILTKDSKLSYFLKRHKIEFIKEQEHIKLYYKKQEVNINLCKNAEYLKRRLGYSRIKDYCFNGFAFRDILYKNEYARRLINGPELIIELDEIFKGENLYKDYYQNSTYFCYEYCIPIEKVIFDENENMSIQEKQRYLITQIIIRLYDYKNLDMKYMLDESNPILRIEDNDIMEENFFIKKEEITEEMLKF